MNRVQCELATALFATLEQVDARIAGAMAPTSVKVELCYAPDKTLDVRMDAAATDVVAGIVVEALRQGRVAVVAELRALGATVTA